MKFSRKQLCIPYAVFLVLFVILPLLIVLYYAFTNGQGQFTFSNFTGFFTNLKTIGTLVYSLLIAFVTTLVCLLLAFPTAYVLAKGPFKRGGVLLMIAVMPMWINFTLRITALKEILNVIEGNLAFFPFLNSIIGMSYDFLPFMILPIYTALLKIDDQLLEAGRDLGATKKTVFIKVLIPLAMPGIVSGITMVFLPAMTNYVVLDMVYNSTYIMGSLIGSYFSAYDWHNGSMIAAILLVFIVLISVVSGKVSGNEKNLSGGALL